MTGQPDLIDGRVLGWAGCLNVRDLGGLPADGGLTHRGAFVRADNLAQLNPEGQAAVLDYGVTMVVDLRSPDELEALPNPFASVRPGGPRYLNLPMIDEPTAAALEDVTTREASYRTILGVGRARTVEIMGALSQASGGVVFHCHGGQDRTGLVAALVLSLAGVSDEVIAADYALTFVHLRSIHDGWVDEATDEAERARREREVRDPERFMDASLAFLAEEYGGAEAYLAGGGLGLAEIERIRRRLIG